MIHETSYEHEPELEPFIAWMEQYALYGYEESLSSRLKDQIDRWAEQGRDDVLLRAVELTELRIRAEEQNWNLVGTMLNVLETVMVQVSPSASLLASLQQLLTERRGAESAFPRNAKQHHLRYYIAVLAEARPLQELMTILEHAAREENHSLEPLALLLYEAVVRHNADRRNPVVQQVYSRIKEHGHPLAWLPLHRTELEQDLMLRHYNKGGGGGYGSSFGPKRRVDKETRRAVEQVAARSAPSASAAYRSVHTPEEAERLQSAVTNWREHSNGKSEAAVFDLEKLHAPVHITEELLVSLGLLCLHGSSASHVMLRSVFATRAFNLLYSAAANGGAYNDGNCNAYGRLEAWKSFAALCGAPVTADAETVLQFAGNCSWWYFDAPTPWFRQVAWDMGIACLRPDGRTLAVLASTDTD